MGDVVIVTGDVHAALAFEVTRDSNNPDAYDPATRAGLNGYLLLDIDRERVEAEYWLVPFVSRPTDQEALDRSFTVRRGHPALIDNAAVVSRHPL